MLAVTLADGFVNRSDDEVDIVGHSLGAIKGVYAVAQENMAQESTPSVRCLCAISPARLSHDYFLSSPAAEEFRGTLARATQLAESGQGETLIEVQFPIPYVVTAAAYLDKDVFVGPYNPVVVNTGQKLVLIDTGTGEAALNQSKGANGLLLSNMAVAGIDMPIDLQPCGGTHIRNTAEIGPVLIGKIENKGRQNRRINIAFAE